MDSSELIGGRPVYLGGDDQLVVRRGRVTAPPASAIDPLGLVVTEFAEGSDFTIPGGQWIAVGTLPVRGDECVVLTDDKGDAWALFGGAQPLDSELSAIAGLTSAADRLPYFTGPDTAALATFTTAGRALVDDPSAAAMLATLGIARGSLTVTWPGGSAHSNQQTVAHGLGSTPSQVVMSLSGTLNVLAVPYPSAAKDSTTLYMKAREAANGVVAGATTQQFDWVAYA